MSNFFFNHSNKDLDNGLETFMDADGDLHFGMKMGDNMGMDIDSGGLYMKIGDDFGIDL